MNQANDQSGLPARERRIPIVCVSGATCSGKSTVIRKLLEPNNGVFSRIKVGCIEVGKALRAKYPPSHFQGQAAPRHTQVEAWSIFTEQLNRCLEDKCDIVFVDGQPRSPDQVQLMEELPHIPVIVHLTARRAKRQERAQVRFASDPEGMALYQAREERDLVELSEILADANLRKWSIFLLPTDEDNPEKLLIEIESWLCALSLAGTIPLSEELFGEAMPEEV